MELLDMPGHLIRRLQQQSSQVFQKQVQAAGWDLTPVQFAAINALSTNPGIDQAQIAAIIGYDRATIGGVIDRLEQKGIVARIVSRHDRRAREVSLTKKGAIVLARMRPIVSNLQADILVGLTAKERTRLLSLVRKTLGVEK
ncbi:MAG: MarR family transcriptional regulator [Rhodobacterales bacterium]|jgi:MarR family transcriptional regulator, temperature-dependent positive regulator of motility|nr:MarR family transcriptional regulator [Pseudomonadota bacterium]MDA1286350.1 MarR family transcriptional regulator [Pseudomonadota bacterium]NQW14096.1 MarR family transcriptional regulator [Rhodobacter sp.]HBN32056.1 MarR family transcriptional regulator [Paracoccaceae bacterium]